MDNGKVIGDRIGIRGEFLYGSCAQPSLYHKEDVWVPSLTSEILRSCHNWSLHEQHSLCDPIVGSNFLLVHSHKEPCRHTMDPHYCMQCSSLGFPLDGCLNAIKSKSSNSGFIYISFYWFLSQMTPIEGPDDILNAEQMHFTICCHSVHNNIIPHDIFDPFVR